MTEKGLYDHDADFGNGYYNDHHFHYGYRARGGRGREERRAASPRSDRRERRALLRRRGGAGGWHLSIVWMSTRHGLAARAAQGLLRGALGRRHLLHGPGQGPGRAEAANAHHGAYLLALSLGDVALADWCRIAPGDGGPRGGAAPHALVGAAYLAAVRGPQPRRRRARRALDGRADLVWTVAHLRADPDPARDAGDRLVY